MSAARFLRRADFILLGAALALAAIGCLMIYSCTRTGLAEGGGAQWAILKLQLMWVALGLIALVVTMSLDYSRLPSLHLPIYGLTLALLGAVLAMPAVRGTHRWIAVGPVNLQPSEFAQLALLITIAAVASARDHLHDFVSVTKTFVWLVPPLVLILGQPDLGTPVVMVGVWFVLVFFAGVRWSHLAGYASAMVLLFSAAWFSGLIKDYQKARLLNFLNPAADATGDGYQLLQSLIAIGHGGFFGLGLFKGTQTRLHYIPDQRTDFIFTAVAEELGFLGAFVVLALFGVLLWRCTVAIMEAKDPFGRLLAAGVTGLIGLHLCVNLGMTLGLLPVKGMPLPLVSYGGSSMLVTMVAIGLVESVHMRRHKIAFGD